MYRQIYRQMYRQMYRQIYRQIYRQNYDILAKVSSAQRINSHKKAHKQVVGLEVFSDVTGSVCGSGGSQPPLLTSRFCVH